MASGWLWFFGLLWAYLLLVFWLVRSGKMQQWNLSLMLGFILMIRTQRGKRLLETLSRPRVAWNVFGDVGILVAWASMIGFTFLMVLTVGPSLDPSTGLQAASASEIFAIPGINPFIPLWYGLLGLIVTLVVHEGGHGVLARANDLKVKSLGLLFAIVPIGAFVEPDEDEVKEASRRKRLRVFSAGPAVNVAVALLSVLAFGALLGSATLVPGAGLAAVNADGPAHAGGLGPGDIITGVNETPVADWPALSVALSQRMPGETVRFTTHAGGAHDVTLGNRWDDIWSPQARQAVEREDENAMATCAALYGEEARSYEGCWQAARQDPVIGVAIFDSQVPAVMAAPLDSARGFLTLIQLPIQEVRGQPILSKHLPIFMETPIEEKVFWPLVNIVFWIFWLNFLVGVFNTLPMLPLDGGHIFRDSVAGIVQAVRPGIEPERRDRFVGRAAGLVSFAILGIILIQIFGPRLAPFLG